MQNGAALAVGMDRAYEGAEVTVVIDGVPRRGKLVMSNPSGEHVPVEIADLHFESSRRPRGFAALSAERRREISAKGGAAAQASGRGHRFTTESGKEAGRKGGLAPHVSRGGPRRAECGS